MQRGTEAWKTLYAARTVSERTNRDDQEVIDNRRPPTLLGLKAFRFAGAIRTLAHLLRRAITCILDVTYTMGQRLPVKTCAPLLFESSAVSTFGRRAPVWVRAVVRPKPSTNPFLVRKLD